MPAKNIVVGQKVQTELQARAREFRHEMTASEQILWQHLRQNQQGDFHFRRQQVIDGFVVDFYCHAAGLVIEVDGPIHIQQAARDDARDQVLSGRGLLVLRFKNEQISQNLPDVLETIVASCRARAQPRPDPRS